MTKHKQQSLSQFLHKQLTEHGAALRKAPYLRPEMEEKRPHLRPDDQGFGTLAHKLTQQRKEHGISLIRERNI